ncbi:hypothetical protein QO003_000823 [Arthrobacter silviterrae]|uniref:Uncharacterized protein n=1 Tax=Arthrobacter silviterrae TaxID=2026658 RepID=A0ABX0DF23_9MICC|nr:hypothetical protein [Arthrobacter silviterrae]MDQ0276520.1 hypothetical protein [Arthrobacter silviterrae]NGN85186.1 hypothetical protein [Arthrobacter silviterrae]
MIPVDGSTPNKFDGIDYTAYFRGAEVYDIEAATSRVLDLVGDFLEKKNLMSRRCFPSGIGGATGGPEFFEILRWVQEHMQYIAGLVTVWLARVAKVRNKWRQLKGHIDERFLDPYKPSCVVELGVRTKGEGNHSREKSAKSFKSVLIHVPEIDALLRRELPDQRFTIRVLTCGVSPIFAYAYFRVPEVKRSDVAKMIRFLEKRKNQDRLSAVLLYRQFGFITRFRASEDGRDFMRMTMR